MSMPEAAVYEDYCIVFWKDEVRFTRIPFVANTVAKAGFEKSRADLFFRFCIFCADVRHVFMAGFNRKRVHNFIITGLMDCVFTNTKFVSLMI